MSAEPQFDGYEVVKKVRSEPVTDWYLAKQRSVGRSVVIKALVPHVAPDSPFAAPLRREAQLLASLRHRNIVQLFDFVDRPKASWLVLEHVDGVALDEWLRSKKRLSVRTALAIAIEILDALELAHSQGVVHGDLQPRNILVARSGAVKLDNFFAAAERDDPKAAQLVEGRQGFSPPAYMSPEQVLGETLEPRSDLFTLGSLLFEMVSGRRPFEAEDSRTTAQRVRREAPPVLTRFLPDVKPSVERLINRALAKFPADRFANAAEMRHVAQQCANEYGPEPNTSVLVREFLGDVGPLRSAHALPALLKAAPIGRDVVILVAAIAVYFGGVGLIERIPDPAPHSDVAAARGPLPLVPERAASLRVVATPWAHVHVDGEHVATTPFAHGIPLNAGVHHVRLEHPAATVEERKVELAPGQTLLLDVQMTLKEKIAPDPALDLLSPPADAGLGP